MKSLVFSEASQHKTMFRDTESHKKFLDTQLKKTTALQKNYPHIDLSPFFDHFDSAGTIKK